MDEKPLLKQRVSVDLLLRSVWVVACRLFDGGDGGVGDGEEASPT